MYLLPSPPLDHLLPESARRAPVLLTAARQQPSHELLRAKERAARRSATSSLYQIGRVLGFTQKQFCDLGISWRKYFFDAVTRSASSFDLHFHQLIRLGTKTAPA